MALATAEGKLLLFTPEFDVLYEQDLDDNDLTFYDKKEPIQDSDKVCSDACISWRGDSQIFEVNYKINGGHKCLTRDVQQGLKVAKGPARADDKSVFSVAEKPIKDL